MAGDPPGPGRRPGPANVSGGQRDDRVAGAVPANRGEGEVNQRFRYAGPRSTSRMLPCSPLRTAAGGARLPRTVITSLRRSRQMVAVVGSFTPGESARTAISTSIWMAKPRSCWGRPLRADLQRRAHGVRHLLVQRGRRPDLGQPRSPAARSRRCRASAAPSANVLPPARTARRH